MKLLLAVDLSEDPSAHVRLAAEWAKKLGGKLSLAFAEGALAVSDFLSDPHVRALLEQEAERMRARDRQRLDDLLGALPPELRGESLLLRGEPIEALLEAAHSHDALVVITHGRTGLARMWLGSVAEHLVRRATVPVIVLKAPAAGA
jgi:nucleotide-binding universal stress UspA family protein